MFNHFDPHGQVLSRPGCRPEGVVGLQMMEVDQHQARCWFPSPRAFSHVFPGGAGQFLPTNSQDPDHSVTRKQRHFEWLQDDCFYLHECGVLQQYALAQHFMQMVIIGEA
jgi:hypothetical protein